MKAAVFPNFQKNNALDCAKMVCGYLHASDIEVYIDESYRNDFSDKDYIKYGLFDDFVKSADFAVAIGGDGTILKCARHIVNCETKLLGINTGRLGFMASMESDQVNLLEKLKSGDYCVSERMMLEAEIQYGNETQICTALNDIVVSGIYSKICDFDIYSDDLPIGSYRADGVIFSTPTGSTAYSMSAGGPIIEPDVECIEMTLICPHSLFARPMIFSHNKEIKFISNSVVNPEIFVCIDGNKPVHLQSGGHVKIRKSKDKIKLINMSGDTFFCSLNRKLMRTTK